MLSWGLGREVFIRNKQTPMKGSERKQGWAAGEIGLRWKPHKPQPAWQEALEQTDAAPQRPPSSWHALSLSGAGCRWPWGTRLRPSRLSAAEADPEGTSSWRRAPAAFPAGYFLKGDVLVHRQWTTDSFHSARGTKIECNE